MNLDLTCPGRHVPSPDGGLTLCTASLTLIPIILNDLFNMRHRQEGSCLI